MKSNFQCFVLALCGFLWAGPLPGSAASLGTNRRLKLLTACGYLPQLPILVRVEVLGETGRCDWSLWEAEAGLSTDTPGVALPMNRTMAGRARCPHRAERKRSPCASPAPAR